jgi:Ca-activated chloride channel family protein
VQPARQFLSSKSIQRLLACVVAWSVCSGISARAQLPYVNTGAGDSSFSQIDFAAIYLDEMNQKARKTEAQRAQDKELIDSGVVSALDLDAPNNAVVEFNRATSFLKEQNSKEAMKHLQKAIEEYPKFVSAHVSLGLAYAGLDDTGRAKGEFEAAVKLDDKFPGAFLNLGLLALSQNDFSTARSQLEKASRLTPNAKILSALAYAQNGAHAYPQALQTAERVHALEHKGMANVHYVAAAAAMALNNFDIMERELNFFVSEDPTNAFAPVARQNLAALAHNKAVRAEEANRPPQVIKTSVVQASQTFPNTEKLKAELNALGDEADGGSCGDCDTLAEADTTSMSGSGGTASDASPGLSIGAGAAWTIRKNVDQVALFFAASSHGHVVSDLKESDIEIRDDSKPPEQVLQFTPQSKLPLLLALLVDTSGSVHDRFSFEKHAAAQFVQKVLSSTSDRGFIAGFSGEPTVMQDFSSEPDELGKGIEKLKNGGGTALFDAVSFACWKLAAYPERERVAKVLVVLSDGEDNSSHSSLKQSIQAAEKTGVTIYTVSTREDRGDKTDADRVLEQLAERSGGEAMFPGDMLTLGKSFDKLRDVIRSRYFIAYKPADFQPNGNYRTINIIAKKDGKRLQVRARNGYHARLETDHN